MIPMSYHGDSNGHYPKNSPSYKKEREQAMPKMQTPKDAILKDAEV